MLDTYLKYTNSIPMSGDGRSLLYVGLKVTDCACLSLFTLSETGRSIHYQCTSKHTHTLVTNYETL